MLHKTAILCSMAVALQAAAMHIPLGLVPSRKRLKFGKGGWTAYWPSRQHRATLSLQLKKCLLEPQCYWGLYTGLQGA